MHGVTTFMVYVGHDMAKHTISPAWDIGEWGNWRIPNA